MLNKKFENIHARKLYTFIFVIFTFYTIKSEVNYSIS